MKCTRLFMCALAMLAPRALLAGGSPPAASPIKLPLGHELPALEFPAETLAELNANLEKAQAGYDAEPENEFAAIWLGRRLAYLGRFRESIDVYTKAIGQHPKSTRLLRHRGHRYITTREFAFAIEDLKKAAQIIDRDQSPDEIEEDGQPNKMNIPRSTLHTNIYYHLGIAYYDVADFGRAYGSFLACAEIAPNDDIRVAAWNWLILSARRWAGEDAKRRLRVDRDIAQIFEQINPNMEILENASYHELLLHYAGVLTREQAIGRPGSNAVDDATRAYALGAWSLINGKPDDAIAQWNEVVKGKNRAAFGFIAAEAELKRHRDAAPAPAGAEPQAPKPADKAAPATP